jgi:hypothetical protein
MRSRFGVDSRKLVETTTGRPALSMRRHWIKWLPAHYTTPGGSSEAKTASIAPANVISETQTLVGMTLLLDAAINSISMIAVLQSATVARMPQRQMVMRVVQITDTM